MKEAVASSTLNITRWYTQALAFLLIHSLCCSADQPTREAIVAHAAQCKQQGVKMDLVAQFGSNFAGLDLSGLDLRGVHTVGLETNSCFNAICSRLDKPSKISA